MLHPSSQDYMVSQPRRQNSIFTLLKTLNLRISSYITPTSYLEHPWFKHIPQNAHCQRVSLASIAFSVSDVAILYKKPLPCRSILFLNSSFIWLPLILHIKKSHIQTKQEKNTHEMLTK